MVRPVSALSSRRNADHDVDLGRAQARHHLVEQQQLGLGRERARDFEPLAVGQGEALGQLVAAVGEAEALQDRPRPRARASASRGRRCSAPMVTFSSTLRPLNGRTIWKVRPTPASHTRSGRRPEIVLAVEADGAGGRRVDAGDHVEDRGLARAVGSDQRVDRAGRHAEADIVHRAQAAEALAEAGELEPRAAHRLRSAKPSRAASHGQTPAGRYITITSRARP